MKKFLGVLFILVLVFSLAAIGSPSPVQAATFTVNSTADATDANPGDGVCDDGMGNCTLRAAIMEANAWPGHDTIILPAGTYTLTIAGANEDAAATGDLDITDDLTITGAGKATTIIDGGFLDRLFQIHSVTVDISGVTVQNGSCSDSGGGIWNWGTLTLTSSAVNNNTTTGANHDGGGIFNGLTMTLTNCTVSSNTASDDGGGISHYQATITLTNCTISGNTASDEGGGIHNWGAIAGTMVVLTNCTISDNTASGEGGGISGSVTMTDSTVSGNTASGPGGGISGSVTMTNSTISGNTASGT